MEDFAGRQSRAIEQISEQTAVGFVPLGPFGRTHKIELERDVRRLQQIIVDVGNDRDAIALSQRFERRQNIWVKLHLLASSKKKCSTSDGSASAILKRANASCRDVRQIAL